MNYLPLPDEAARQVIDAQTIFTELQRVRAQAAPLSGGMYWKKEGGYEYLVKTGARNRQTRVGPRSPELEQVYAQFKERKTAVQTRLSSLEAAAEQARRLNKAVKAGRVPAIVIDILNKLEETGLAQHFVVVGKLRARPCTPTNRRPGRGSVRGALATQDVDLLWDARRRARFLADIKHLDKSVRQVLQEVDPTFERARPCTPRQPSTPRASRWISGGECRSRATRIRSGCRTQKTTCGP